MTKQVLTFEEWKTSVHAYLEDRTPAGENWEFILGGDDDMRQDYDEGILPEDYVENNIEDASR